MSRWNGLRPLLVLGVLLGVMLAAVACTTPGSGKTGFAFTPVSGTPEGSGARATDFQISVYWGQEVVGGNEVNFADLIGKRPVVLNFWAGLCPPCRVEMPDLQALYDENRESLLLFGLDVGPFVGLGSREDGQRLLQELNVTFPTGTTFDPQVVRQYGLVGVPTTIFIRKDGTIHRQWTGLLNKKKLDEFVKELLAASGAAEG